MAQQRKKASPKLIADLKRQVGGKCANPGCSARRTQVHHIQQWAVYQTHDEKHMVAVCPSCHDEIHHGQIEIADDVVYAWKHLKRLPARRDHLYVEPGSSSKLLLGTLAVTGDDAVTVFDLGPSNRLRLRIEDEDVMLLDLAIATTSGQEVLRVQGGHVRYQADVPITYERTQGHIRVTAPVTDDFIPPWVIDKMRPEEPGFAANGRVVLLDLQVLEPGLVRVQGVWTSSNESAVVITSDRLSFVASARPRPVSLVGDGKESVIHYAGPITGKLFGFGRESRSLGEKAIQGKIGRNGPCHCGSGRKWKKCHGREGGGRGG